VVIGDHELDTAESSFSGGEQQIPPSRLTLPVSELHGEHLAETLRDADGDESTAWERITPPSLTFS